MRWADWYTILLSWPFAKVYVFQPVWKLKTKTKCLINKFPGKRFDIVKWFPLIHKMNSSREIVQEQKNENNSNRHRLLTKNKSKKNPSRVYRSSVTTHTHTCKRSSVSIVVLDHTRNCFSLKIDHPNAKNRHQTRFKFKSGANTALCVRVCVSILGEK